MPSRRRRTNNTMKMLGILFITVSLFACGPLQVAAQNDLTLSLTRNLGIGFGNIIQGTFTLHGSGPEDVQNLTVYFNGEQVHFVTGNTIAWTFQTGDYPPGVTNITLFGVDNAGETYVASTNVMILGEEVALVVIGIIMAIVVFLVIVKYGPMIQKRRGRSSG